MKAMDIFCASQASTAVCLPTPDHPSSSPSPLQPGGATAGRAIDRHNPIITDSKRITCRTFPNPPCSSQYSPVNPRPYHQLHTAAAAADQINPDGSATQKGLKKKKKKTTTTTMTVKKSSFIITTDIVRWSCAKPSDLATPPGSMRYLLSDKSFRDGSLDRHTTSSVLPSETNKKVTPSPSTENRNETKSTTEILSSSSECKTSPPPNQVVVLRVSLHCRGCEGKLRKHLSKMEGVSSFNIDFAAKKVTIMGNITPQGVLESVSKVKNAQFWPSADPTPPSSSSLQNPNFNQQKNVLKNA